MKHTTPVPNVLLDTYMPRLRDTEWRVLLIVVRQTLGWTTKSGERKAKDWISHLQFQAKTGRGGDAVSNAIDSLVRQGLIEAQDARGRFLKTKASRKSRFARLYYRLGPVLQETVNSSTRGDRLDKVGTTKATADKRNSYKRPPERLRDAELSTLTGSSDHERLLRHDVDLV